MDVPEESSCELPSELATSEVDSHIKSVLHPNFVRERIAGLAYQRLNKERQKKVLNTLNAFACRDFAFMNIQQNYKSFRKLR